MAITARGKLGSSQNAQPQHVSHHDDETPSTPLLDIRKANVGSFPAINKMMKYAIHATDRSMRHKSEYQRRH
jgi:hypothetical protein